MNNQDHILNIVADKMLDQWEQDAIAANRKAFTATLMDPLTHCFLDGEVMPGLSERILANLRRN